jgi:hypothetical protein
MGVPIVFLHSLIDFPMQGHFLPAVVFLILGVAARAGQEGPIKGGLTPILFT